MDLDDELDGPSQANARTSKFLPKSSRFAPKLKSNPKTKAESSAQLKDSAPKQESEQNESEASASKKKENGADSILPVSAEPKTESSASNGVVKMEIDSKSKAEEVPGGDDAMEKDHKQDEEEEEGDTVVREIDVFLTPSIDANTKFYVLQYPLRPCWRPYDIDERCEEVRVNPSSAQVEVDLSLDVDSNNYDKEYATKLQITKQTLHSVWGPRTATGHAVGVLVGDKLHLNPIHALVQLRPTLSCLKSGVSKKKNTAVDSKVNIKVEESDEGKSVGPSNKQSKQMHSSNEQKANDEECWIPLKYHNSKSHLSAQYMQRMMEQENSPLQFTMNQVDYVDSICPVRGNNVKVLPSSKRFLLSMPLEDRFRKLLCEGPFHRFSVLVHYAPDAAIEDVFLVLQKLALLVQGLWVLKSQFLFPQDQHKCLARDYLLLLLRKSPSISKSQIDGPLRLDKSKLVEILKVLARERPDLGDWLMKEPPDVAFIKGYPGIVSQQEQVWAAGEQTVMNLVQRAQSGPSKTKPAIVNKPGKPMNPDKGVRKAMSAAQVVRTMSDETREAIPKALKKVFQTHKVCSLQLIRKGLRDLAISQSTLPKADARLVLRAADGADAPEHELQEVISQVAVEIDGRFVLKSSPEHPECDSLRSIVIDLLRVHGKLKKADVMAAASIALKKEISAGEYNKVVSEFCEYKNNAWVLKSGDGKPN